MKIRHQDGAVAEVSDEYGEALLKTNEWTLVEDSPAPVKRPRKTAAPKVAVEVKPEGALASEE